MIIIVLSGIVVFLLIALLGIWLGWFKVSYEGRVVLTETEECGSTDEQTDAIPAEMVQTSFEILDTGTGVGSGEDAPDAYQRLMQKLKSDGGGESGAKEAD